MQKQLYSPDLGSYLVVDKEERDGEYAKKYKGHMVDQVTSGFYIVTGILLLVLDFSCINLN